MAQKKGTFSPTLWSPSYCGNVVFALI